MTDYPLLVHIERDELLEGIEYMFKRKFKKNDVSRAVYWGQDNGCIRIWFDGEAWEYIPPLNQVAWLRFNGPEGSTPIDICTNSVMAYVWTA